MTHRTLSVVPVQSGLPTMSSGDAVRAQGVGAFVLDVRDHRHFAAGHLPGSVNITLGGSDFVATCAGLLAPGVEIVVVGAAAPADTAADLLRAEGLGPIVGRVADPGSGSVSRRIGPASIGREQVLDVRDDGPSPRGALRIPLRDLPGRLVELRPDAPVAVLDDDGRRSSTAASLLRACGFLDVVEVLPAAAPVARPRLRLLASA